MLYAKPLRLGLHVNLPRLFANNSMSDARNNQQHKMKESPMDHAEVMEHRRLGCSRDG